MKSNDVLLLGGLGVLGYVLWSGGETTKTLSQLIPVSSGQSGDLLSGINDLLSTIFSGITDLSSSMNTPTSGEGEGFIDDLLAALGIGEDVVETVEAAADKLLAGEEKQTLVPDHGLVYNTVGLVVSPWRLIPGAGKTWPAGEAIVERARAALALQQQEHERSQQYEEVLGHPYPETSLETVKLIEAGLVTPLTEPVPATVTVYNVDEGTIEERTASVMEGETIVVATEPDTGEVVKTKNIYLQPKERKIWEPGGWR